MSDVLLTKRTEFAAAHRYWRDGWDAERNRAAFGACAQASGHGHNYLLEVTVAGEVDEVTGMVFNMTDLKLVLKDVLSEFDHRHLNLDTPYFTRDVPTTENLAWILWRLLESRARIGRLHQIRLFQDEDLYADLTAEIVASSKPGRKAAQLTRRYHFAAAHRLHDPQRSEPDNLRLYGACGGPQAHGHNYVLHVTVAGDIDPDTGMVTHLSALDRVVQDAVLNRLDHQDLNVVPELSAVRPTGENLARFVWNRLVKAIPGGRLARVGLDETRDVSYEYAGS